MARPSGCCAIQTSAKGRERVVRAFRELDMALYEMELEQTSILERHYGIAMGAKGWFLVELCWHLVAEGQLVAFRDAGHVAFVSRARWRKDVVADPSLAAQQITSSEEALK